MDGLWININMFVGLSYHGSRMMFVVAATV